MTRPTRDRRRARRARRGLALASTDEDPLTGLANLFDAGMVFALALLVSLISYNRLPDSASEGTPQLEDLQHQGRLLERFRVSNEELQGEGQRLGTAYRLKNGEVVYVPETPGR